MLRVLLCDDAVAFGVLLERWVDAAEGMRVVARTAIPEDAAGLAAEHQPDVIVLDHMLGSRQSSDMVPLLRAAAPAARILLISGMSPDRLEEAAATCGADGCITKASRPERICDAMRDVAGLERQPGAR